jgi:hypothetical protein
MIQPVQKIDRTEDMNSGMWIPLAIMLLLCSVRIAVGHWWGKGWEMIAAIAAALIWFILRPWRFGLMTSEMRRRLRFQGSLLLCVLALSLAIQHGFSH